MTFLTTITRFLALSTGESIFYREAGAPTSPTILLLHGYPSSSHQFRNLIPLLAPEYRVIAPDFPGFGFTNVSTSYTYTFDALAATVSTFLSEIHDPPTKYAIYIFDYGAPVGLRLALEHPDRISAIITQNGNAYASGLGSFWDPIRTLWNSNNSGPAREALVPFLQSGTKGQYTDGEPDPAALDPAAWTLDQALLEREGVFDIQLDLMYDYRTNLELYPKVQEWFRESQVPLIAVWGRNDVIFPPVGAEAYKGDLPGAEVNFLDAGHFAMEWHTGAVAGLILEFLGRKGI
ncbi:putative hydrolase [Karstenula rhodostoma CBS 690.94]|uniref:Hydrolase n=1 Tax=Karstenula rhodostoma CBS 690.94 TaxID=1392251 RepID=A0A9P4P4T3_9PLEO|nr:putative hydrolase [Karstenula rhodostoma CBS 690.94]